MSESTVYRILRREGLVKSPEMKMAAGQEPHTKTTKPHQMWATDASYFRVVGWGFYYMARRGGWTTSPDSYWPGNCRWT